MVVARKLEDIANLLELNGDNPFKIRAYRKAASNIEGLSADVSELVRAGEIEQIPGVGKDLAQRVSEFVTTGKISFYEELTATTPETLLEVLQVPGLGPKKVKYLFEHLGTADIEGLERAVGDGKLKGLPGFGDKTEKHILEGINLVKQSRDLTLLGWAKQLAGEIVEALKASPGVGRIEITGGLRRCRETVRGIYLLVSTTDPELVLDHFVSLPQVGDVVTRTGTSAEIRVHEGDRVNLITVDPESFGAALLCHTGSPAHIAGLKSIADKHGLKIDESGLFREKDKIKLGGSEEGEIYRTLDLPLFEPEIREGTGEIEAAISGELPELVKLSDIKGDLHTHTELSDGLHSLEEVVEYARGLGYGYIAITEHSKSLRIAGGITEGELRSQMRKIKEMNEGLEGFRILSGIEVDILKDGSLDFPDEVLAECDVVIASVHSAFRQPREEMTARIVKALENPHVDVFAHPTGRLLGQRDAYEVDMNALLDTASRTGTALEINAHPMRLDLDDRHSRMAREHGVKLIVNTDMHGLEEFRFMDLGISVARRAWCSKNDILNTEDVVGLLERLHS